MLLVNVVPSVDCSIADEYIVHIVVLQRDFLLLAVDNYEILKQILFQQLLSDERTFFKNKTTLEIKF